MGLWETATGWVNQATSPFGVKLFKGGPYQGRDRVYESEDIYRILGQIGTNLLGLSSNVEGEDAQSEDAQSETANGITDQLGTQVTGLRDMLSSLVQSGGNYRLRDSQRAQLNQSIGGLNTQRDQAMASVRQKLAQRGITGPAADAAMQRISEAYNEAGMRQTADFTEQSRSQHMSDLGALMQQLLGLHQYGTGLLGTAARGNMEGGAAEAQAAAQAAQQLGSTIAFLYGTGSLNFMLPKEARVVSPGNREPSGTTPAKPAPSQGWYGGGYGPGGWGGGQWPGVQPMTLGANGPITPNPYVLTLRG